MHRQGRLEIFRSKFHQICQFSQKLVGGMLVHIYESGCGILIFHQIKKLLPADFVKSNG